MQVESELYSALLDTGISKEKAERVADALLKSIDQRYMAHFAVISRKVDIEAFGADMLRVLNEQTWKLAGIVLAAMGFIVAATKLISN